MYITASQEEEKPSTLRNDFTILMKDRSFRVLLVTGWIMYGIDKVFSYMNLYLRALGWSFVLIGAVSSLYLLVRTAARFVGGFIGDTRNRRTMSVATMGLTSVAWLMLGISAEFWMVVSAYMFFGFISFIRSGASAYLYTRIPRKPRDLMGLGNSLFQSVGPIWSLPVLFALAIWTNMFPLVVLIQDLFLFGGFLLFFCTLLRWRHLSHDKSSPEDYLDGNPIPKFRNVITENIRAVKIIISLVPGLLLIGVLDTLSDAMFNYGALIYANEFAGVSYAGISLILIVVVLVQAPLGLMIGRKMGINDENKYKAALGIYSIIPLSVALVLVAPSYPFIPFIPHEWIQWAGVLFPGGEVIFSTVFLGLILKSINDNLWATILFTVIGSKFPKKDWGKTSSMYFSIVVLIATIAPTLAGVMFESIGPEWMFAMLIMLNIALIITIVATKFGMTPQSSTEIIESAGIS
ncbi:MAG: MFS transporter [Candidatus Thorarchaeota archaeon]|nr:MFS transporter [Candidatus Thorarchaeota archaeon]